MSYYGSPFEPRYLVYGPRIDPNEANMIFKTESVTEKNEYVKSNPFLCVFDTRKKKIIRRFKTI